VSNEFKKASAKGQIPFVELNGRQFSDSNQIIEHLRSHFKLAMDGKLNSLERANARAYTILIEESLFRWAGNLNLNILECFVGQEDLLLEMISK
jgi:hypothetical protein